MRCDRLARCALFAGAVLALAATASAQAPSASNREAAAKLFQEGKALLDSGQPVEACDRLGQSDQLEKAVGTLGLLAACNEVQGKVATAHRYYLQAAELAKANGDARAQFATDRAAALAPKVPQLLLRLPPGVVQARITKNGELVHPERVGVEHPIDPGTFEIVATSPGRVDFRRTVTATLGNKLVVDITLDVPTADTSRAPPASGPWRTAAIVAGGVGIVGLGVGAVAGVVAMNKNNDSDPLCNAQNQCTPEGGSLRDGAKTAATVSTVAFVAGAVGVAAGVTLFFTLGRAKSAPTTAIGVGPSGAVVRGGF